MQAVQALNSWIFFFPINSLSWDLLPITTYTSVSSLLLSFSNVVWCGNILSKISLFQVSKSDNLSHFLISGYQNVIAHWVVFLVSSLTRWNNMSIIPTSKDRSCISNVNIKYCVFRVYWKREDSKLNECESRDRLTNYWKTSLVNVKKYFIEIVNKRKLLKKIISVASGARYFKVMIFLKQMKMIFTILTSIFQILHTCPLPT